jgi:hypothetical protein
METQGSEGNNYGSKWDRRALIHTMYNKRNAVLGKKHLK